MRLKLSTSWPDALAGLDGAVMRRPPALLAGLLAVLLFWQAAAAAAHCLASAGTPTVMEICGPDGLRLLPLADDQAPHTTAVCAVCHLLPGTALQPPDGLALSLCWSVLAEATGAIAHQPPLPARAPAHRPTGPPALA